MTTFSQLPLDARFRFTTGGALLRKTHEQSYGRADSPYLRSWTCSPDAMVLATECQHPRQKWKIDMTSGTCRDCGATLGPARSRTDRLVSMAAQFASLYSPADRQAKSQLLGLLHQSFEGELQQPSGLYDEVWEAFTVFLIKYNAALAEVYDVGSSAVEERNRLIDALQTVLRTKLQ